MITTNEGRHESGGSDTIIVRHAVYVCVSSSFQVLSCMPLLFIHALLAVIILYYSKHRYQKVQ